MQTRRGVVPLLPGALDKNQCGSSLPATAAPQIRCAADESTPTREQVPGPKSPPVRERRAGAGGGGDSLPGTGGDGAAPRFKASAGHCQPTCSQPASLAVCFSPSPSSETERCVRGGRGKRRRAGRRRARLAGPTRRAGCGRSGPALGDALAPFPGQGIWAGGGCHSPPVVARKGAALCLQPRSLPWESAAVGADRDASCYGNHPEPSASLRACGCEASVHLLHVGCSY